MRHLVRVSAALVAAVVVGAAREGAIAEVDVLLTKLAEQRLHRICIDADLALQKVGAQQFDHRLVLAKDLAHRVVRERVQKLHREAIADEGVAVHAAVLVNGHCVDKSDEGHARAERERDNRSGRQHRFGRHIHLRHAGELPQRVDRLISEFKLADHAPRVVSCLLHLADVRLILVSKGVAVEEMNVRHIDGVLKHRPVRRIKLKLTKYGMPVGVLQLGHDRDGGALLHGE
mmetsp:Transcript_2864/g.5109  ORF Transcript_2864/g.5109 Transcript_2864/m.5109 type:complete len:231 (+) Transcript_2864:1803-2495(+)